MVDISGRMTPRQAHDADFDDPELAEYRYQRSHRADTDIDRDEPAPLFLSYPLDEDSGAKYQRGSLERSLGRSLLTSGLLIAAAAAAAVLLVSLDVTRDTMVAAKTWLLGTSQVHARTVMAALLQPVSEPVPPPPTKAAPPSREQITAAYQEAIKGGQVVVGPSPSVSAAPPAPSAAPPAPSAAPQAAPPATPQARQVSPDELSALMKRANSLLAIGDIPAARLLLERAADAQEADAALLLARTYDPLVLGTKDARAITPDPAQARIWYRRAAELGSQHAQQRLTQMQD
ncbi:hypothetical protein OZ411_32670 [Bradyrhizobium sp. Arg237L]|uniref:hypothetical protein n=1 Tax=Bradyrhizobium sp. Arg237L TaxID=3003352 RepID=UPI00249DACAE|nr:hypothetical protein [Bradyrhizobium sp. Arg237L]MDI4237569.1 hypothetical protein [Bradyrhizobium sp. Arg237L]